MRIALVSEDTYPFVVNGVSVWCNQLIQGMPEHEWDMVALTVDGTERPVWTAPGNPRYTRTIPVWGPRPSGRGSRGRAGRPGLEFRSAFAAMVSAALAPLEPGSARPQAGTEDFLSHLHGLYGYAADGGDLSDDAPLLARSLLGRLGQAWR